MQLHQYDCLLGAGISNYVSSSNLQHLDDFLSENKGWKFGYLSYDLKNSIHNFHSDRKNKIGFPGFFFFIPQFFLQLKGNQLIISADDPSAVYNQIINENGLDKFNLPITIQQRLGKKEYLKKIEMLQQHIVRGDCYEINFCQEFFAEDVELNAIEIFQRLAAISPTPFSALYKLDDKYLVCASPERFLTKKGKEIFSQPMKGTIKRDLQSKMNDEDLKLELKRSSKDQSENVMVVDMVRNDLSKICLEASVCVNELFGVYSFPNVHQMISTISGELKPEIKFSKIIEATFPMGSMTGAPKYNVMELIEKYETSSRGIFSGTVGYINPEGDFDFNVVIRSIMYNSYNKYLSYHVGSGITFYSDPEKEWEECLLKAEAIKKVLTS